MLKRIPRQRMTGLHLMLFLVVAVLLFKHACLDLLGYLSMLLVGMVIGDSLHRFVTPDLAQASNTNNISSKTSIWPNSAQAVG